MKKSFLTGLFGLLFIANARAQDQVEKDIKTLHYIINSFLEKTDDYYKGRKSEVVLMILEFDSTGIVKDIHLLGDSKNVDSSYLILQTIEPKDFSGIKFISWRNKAINLPIYSLSSPSYVEKSMIQIKSTVESKKSVIVRPLYYGVLRPIKENPPNRYIKIETKEKN